MEAILALYNSIGSSQRMPEEAAAILTLALITAKANKIDDLQIEALLSEKMKGSLMEMIERQSQEIVKLKANDGKGN